MKPRRCPASHHPRREDSPLNQAILSGLRLGARRTADAGLRPGLRRQAAIMRDTIAEVERSHSFLHRAQLKRDRLTEAYRAPLAIINLLLDAPGLGLDLVDRRLSVPGFTFDMNRFFQRLIDRYLKENLPAFDVIQEYGMKQILTFARQHNPRRRRAPTPWPDFAVVRDGKNVSVLDTKYRDLWELEATPGNAIPGSPVRSCTGERRHGHDSVPTVHGEAWESRLNISTLLTGTGIGQVVLQPMNLLRLAGLVTASHSATDGERRQYAVHLAGLELSG